MKLMSGNAVVLGINYKLIKGFCMFVLCDLVGLDKGDVKLCYCVKIGMVVLDPVIFFPGFKMASPPHIFSAGSAFYLNPSRPPASS